MFDLSSLGNLAKSAFDNKETIANGAKTVTGIFGKSSKPSTEETPSPAQSGNTYSPGLERMIAMAIEDGPLSDEEIKLLTKRAEKEGVDPDEFEFDLRLRIKKHNKELEKIQNVNPVEALSSAFKAIEQNVKGGKKAVDGGAIGSALALIPGVGQAAAVGGLLASFIESPSNRNELKAEIIRVFILPDKEEHLQQFISYAASQLLEEYSRISKKSSLKGMISAITMGDELDIIPIWENKLEEACEKAMHTFPDNELLSKTVRKNRPTLANKLRNGLIQPIDLEDYTGPLPDASEELVSVVEILYSQKQSNSEDWDILKPVHARFYALAESRIDKNSPFYQRLAKCKVKKFGLF